MTPLLLLLLMLAIPPPSDPIQVQPSAYDAEGVDQVCAADVLSARGKGLRDAGATRQAP